jgi:hypothetical protein
MVNTRTRRFALLLAVGVLTVCLGVILHKPTPAQYHLSAITKLRRMHEPKSWHDYLSPNTWAWYMAARPNPMQRDEQIAEHYGWLVDLGSFETRDFYLYHSALDQRGMAAIEQFSDK